MNEATELSFMNCDRNADLLRESIRHYRDSYLAKTHELPDAGIIAASMLLALRQNETSAGALTAMFLGLKGLAAEVLDEARH